MSRLSSSDVPLKANVPCNYDEMIIRSVLQSDLVILTPDNRTLSLADQGTCETNLHGSLCIFVTNNLTVTSVLQKPAGTKVVGIMRSDCITMSNRSGDIFEVAHRRSTNVIRINSCLLRHSCFRLQWCLFGLLCDVSISPSIVCKLAYGHQNVCLFI